MVMLKTCGFGSNRVSSSGLKWHIANSSSSLDQPDTLMSSIAERSPQFAALLSVAQEATSVQNSPLAPFRSAPRAPAGLETFNLGPSAKYDGYATRSTRKRMNSFSPTQLKRIRQATTRVCWLQPCYDMLIFRMKHLLVLVVIK